MLISALGQHCIYPHRIALESNQVLSTASSRHDSMMAPRTYPARVRTIRRWFGTARYAGPPDCTLPLNRLGRFLQLPRRHAAGTYRLHTLRPFSEVFCSPYRGPDALVILSSTQPVILY